MMTIKKIATRRHPAVKNGGKKQIFVLFYLFLFLLLIDNRLPLSFATETASSQSETVSAVPQGGSVTPAQGTVSQDSGIQMLLSQNIEDRVKESIASLLVNEKFSVSVKVWTKKEQERKVSYRTPEEKELVEEEEEILPGIPRFKTSSGEKKQLDQSVIKLISKISIQKIGVRIFVDSNVNDPIIESVKKVASSAAGIDPARGDELVVEKIFFPKAEIMKKMWVSDFLLNPKYLWIAVGAILGLLFLIFLFGPARTLAKSYIQTMQLAVMAKTENRAGTAESEEKKGEVQKGADQSAAMQTADIEMEEALAKASAEISQALSSPSVSKGRDGNGHRPFSFVTEKSLPNFMHLIQREQAPAIAVAVHYLEPSLGAQVLSSLTMETRSLVVQLLSKVQEREPEDVQGLEAKVQARLHYVVGGEDKLRDLVSFAEPEVQPAILSAVRSVNPDLAERVERSMVSVESLGNVDAAVLQAVIKQMGLRNFCPLMLSLTEPLREKIATKLPGGQALRIREEIDLSKALPPARFREERTRLIGILRKLQQEGILAS